MGCFTYRIRLYTANQMCSKLDVNWVSFSFLFWGRGGWRGWEWGCYLEPCVVTRDIQTLWQFVKFSLMVFFRQVFFLPFFLPSIFFFPSFLSNQNVQEGFWN